MKAVEFLRMPRVSGPCLTTLEPVLDLSGSILVVLGPITFFMPSYMPLASPVLAANMPICAGTVAGGFLGIFPGCPERFQCTKAGRRLVSQRGLPLHLSHRLYSVPAGLLPIGTLTLFLPIGCDGCIVHSVLEVGPLGVNGIINR